MSTEGERPLLASELAAQRYEAGDRTAYDGLPRAPHCDSRILHAPNTGCDFCTEATELQEERERLDISNSGMTNRKWPCPADQARPRAQYEAWGGNKPKTREQLDEEGREFAEALRRLGKVVDHE